MIAMFETVLIVACYVCFPLSFYLGYRIGKRRLSKVDERFSFALWDLITRNQELWDSSLENDGNIQEVCDHISKFLSKSDKTVFMSADTNLCHKAMDFSREMVKDNKSDN